MKRSYKSVLGVTLLEIMLVLAIAAMIIVMSIRYYQSASNNQKVAAAADDIVGIVAAGESYLAAIGSLASFSNTTANAYLPGGVMPTSPWGGKIAVTPGAGPNSYVINIDNVPTASSCPQLLNLLTSQNNKLTGSTCTAITVTE